jgi:uncharacterized protein (TIGR04255 family)
MLTEVTTSKPPVFDRPPVEEVALGVYFNPIAALDSIRLGLLWERWRDRYPHVEEQPALPPLVPEAFDRPSLSQTIFFGQPAFPRVWYQSQGRDQLVQVQRDRLVHNWRHLAATQQYPHYDELRPRFEEDAADFFSYIALLGHELPPIVQAEVTYVNPIPVGDRGNGEALARLMAPWSGTMSDSFLPNPEDIALTLRYRIPGPDGKSAGRLYITAQPSLRQSAEGRVDEIILLQLFARGAPIGSGLAGALAFLDLGHDWLVRAFKSVTTPEFHHEWGLDSDD